MPHAVTVGTPGTPAIAGSKSAGVDRRFRRGLHLLAMLTAFAVFPLLLVGASVTSKDAGMAYADWPTSDGHLVNPPGWWEQDATRWEHGHRLIGWCVGMLAILLMASSWSSGGTIRILGLSTLGAICVQGVLGGLRVAEVSTAFAMIHGIWGQLTFCLAALTALLTSRKWLSLGPAVPTAAAQTLRRVCLWTSIAIVIQLVLGAALRHFVSDALLGIHVLWAIVASFMIGGAVVYVAAADCSPRWLNKLARNLAILLGLQLMLGGFAWLALFPPGGHIAWLSWMAPSAHVGVGSLLLVCSILLTVSAYRLLEPLRDGEPVETAVPAL